MKKSKNYFLIGLSIFLLVAVSSPLAAWPAWLGGSDSLKVLQLQKELSQKDQEIESLMLSIEESTLVSNEQKLLSESSPKNSLEYEQMVEQLTLDLIDSQNSLKGKNIEIEKLRNDLKTYETQVDEIVLITQEAATTDEAMNEIVKNLQEKIASLNVQLSKAEDSIVKLAAELEMTKTLSGISQEDWDEKFEQYNALELSYVEKSTEADEYYQELVKAKANEDKGIGGMVGAGAIFDADNGTFDATIEAGIEYNGMMLKAGVTYPVDEVMAFNLDLSELKYSAGVQFRF